MKLNLTAIYKNHSRIKLGCGRLRLVHIQLVCALAALILPLFGTAQTATGAQPLGSITSGPDAINLGNLNIHYAFPVFSRPGRGINFTYVLTYDSSIYQPIVSGSTTTWTPVTDSGWRGQTEIATGYISEKSITQNCFISGTHDLGGWTTRNTYLYHDPFGATHAMGTQVIVDNEGAANCPPNSDPPFDSKANDNSGYGMHADDTSIYVTVKGGAIIDAPVMVTTGPANATDSNGNQITVDNSGNFSDTLGTVALSITGSQTAPPMSFNYHDTTGAQQSVIVNYSTFTVQTNFGCAGIGEYGAHTTNLPTSIVYPDNSSYAISYEATPGVPGAVTGRVASVTLRTGGTISYVYRDGSNGVECSDGSTAGFSRTTPDGTMQYDRSGGGTQWTTTVKDATVQQNQTVINFQTAGPNPVNYYETKRQIYAGATTLLRTIDTCYNNIAPDCTAAAITLPITQVNVFTTLENGLQSKVASSFDSIFGRPTETDEYDFGSGAPGALLRKTLTTYAFDTSSVCPNHNVPPDRVCTVTVQNGSGTQVARTLYGYDESTPTATSGVPHHVAASARGNLTSIQQWLNSPSSTLTTNLTYDDTGNVLTTTDPGGHQTSFSYADNFSDSVSLNSQAYVTTVTLPTTHAPNTQTHTTTAKYEVNTGLVTDSYGQNNEHTTFHYDSLLRPIETDFPDNGKTAITYYGTSQIWTWNYLDGTNHTDFRQHIDSLGRMDRTAFLNQEGSWDMRDTCFDANGRPAFTSYTYQDANGWGDPSRCAGAGDAFSYDAVSRPVTITHSDGSQANYAYAGRATQISDEGNGSKTVTRILQSDGLGRISNVCEVSGTTLLGSGGAPASCNLDYTGTGFLTTYGYDTLNNLVHVDQGSLAVRSYVYDSLSRMTSEQFPEQNGNNTTYSYNNDSLLAARVRPAPNNAAGNVTTTYNYDEMDRLTGVSYSDGTTPGSTYNYDESTGWGGTALSNPIGRMTTAYAGGVPGIAASMFAYDAMGRPTQNWQCTPRTCGTSAYYLPYTYDQAGDMLTSGNGMGTSFTSAYNPAARLTQLTSSWNDASHPPTLLSNAHYGPFGLTSDTLGNGLNENYTYHPRGWLQSAAFGGSPAADAQGSVQYSGSEQLHNATYGGGTVTVNFTEPAPVQVQTYQGQQSNASITVNAITPEGKKCIQTEFGRCLEWAYNAGSITINVNGCSVTSYWDETTSAGSVATDLASHLACSTVTASANGALVNLKSVAYSSGADYPFTATYTWDRTDFTSTNYWPTPSSGSMANGANPTYQTVYDTGTATLCIGSNCSYTYAWNQNDNANTVASGLAAAVQRDPSRVANASANGNIITLTAIAIGSGGNYALSASSSYDTAHFGGPAATFSASGMANGSDGLPDSGTATLTVAGLTKTYTWGASDTSSSIANNLAGQLHADPSRQADYTSVGSCGQNCSQINLQATTAGPDPSYNGGISHSDPSGYFPTSSFSSSPASATNMTGGATGSPSLYSYALSFANDGSITGSNDSANGNWTYNYDEFNRLTSSNKNSGAQTFSYAYDRLGNRWQQTAPQGGPAPQYTFDTNNHIQTGSGISYDALGNVVNDGLGNTYTWDAENRLVSINGGVWSYVYDAFGRRVAKKQGGTINSEFIYDLSGDKVTSLDGSGNATAEEIYAGGRHVATYLISTNSTYFHHTDWLGNLRTDSGVSGTSTQTCTGLPFGDGSNCNGTFSSANLLTDDFHDSEDNLEHTLFRKLSTTQGRWMSPDPAGMAAVDFTNPQSLNQYAYVLNDPINGIDPTGLKDIKGGCDPDNPGAACILGGGEFNGSTVDGLDAPTSMVQGLLSSGAACIGSCFSPMSVQAPNRLTYQVIQTAGGFVYIGPNGEELSNDDIAELGLPSLGSSSSDPFLDGGMGGPGAGGIGLSLSLDSDCGTNANRTIHYTLRNANGSRAQNYAVIQYESLASRAGPSLFGPGSSFQGAGEFTDTIDRAPGRGPSNSIQTFFAAQILPNGQYGPRIPVLVVPTLNPTQYQAPWSKIGVYIDATNVFVQGTNKPSLAGCNSGY